MKNHKHQQAKNLYFQTNLSKTEIANQLGVNRRTIMLWSQQGNWDRLKLSSQHLPAMVAEKCYFLLDHYTTHLLSSNAVISNFGPKEANAINQMATSIKKLKNRNTVNEAMEMFNFFIEYVKNQDPEMVELVAPLVEGYIASRKDTNIDSFVPSTFNNQGFMDEEKREQEIIERWKDETDQPLMEQEYFEFLKHLEQKKQAKESNADNSTCHGEPRRTMTAETSTQAEDGLPERSRRETADDSTQAEEQLLSERSRRETADDSTQAEEQLFPQRSRRETAEDNDFTLDDLGLDPHQREEFTRILQSPIPIPGFEHLQPNLNKPDNESDNEDDALTLAA